MPEQLRNQDLIDPLPPSDPKPQSVQFAHFGVLDDGKRSKGAALTSIMINIAIALIIVVVGMIVKSNPAIAKQVAELTLPPEPPKPAPKPPPPPPPPPVKLPDPPKIAEPKIKLPEIEKVPDIKPIVVPIPKPVVMAPAPPKAVTPPPAPVKVNLAMARAASVTNNDAHPSAVRLGASDNPLKPLTGAAASAVNLGVSGMRGMPAGNTGNGARATAVNMGSGSPGSHNMNGGDNAGNTIRGVKLGVTGGTGPMNSRNYANTPVNLRAEMAQPVVHAAVQAKLAKLPVVTFKPDPAYTPEAKAMHLEGNVSVRIRVSAEGVVQVLGVVHGLGHGLDESAVQAAQATRFRPAVDSEGHPVDWEGVVLVTFQMG
jgi:TonB family protein